MDPGTGLAGQALRFADGVAIHKENERGWKSRTPICRPAGEGVLAARQDGDGLAPDAVEG